MMKIQNNTSYTEPNITEENDRGFEIIDCFEQKEKLDNEIAGFTQQRLLEVINLVKLSYYVSDYNNNNNRFDELKSRGYKIPSQLKEEGYKIAQFYNLDSKGQPYRHAGYFFGKEKEVCIVYRGSRTYFDYIQDLKINLISVMSCDVKTHTGFYSLFKDSWESIYKILKGYANEKFLEIKDLKITLTGHSMGGAIANIAALCLRMTEDTENLHVATFGSPGVFDSYGAEFYDEYLGKNTIRVVNSSDIVPLLLSDSLRYKHVGEQLIIGIPAIGCDHQLDIYRNLILNMERKDFKSDNSIAVYYHSYFFSVVFNGLTLLVNPFSKVYNGLTLLINPFSNYYENDGIQYFKQIQEKNKNASFFQSMENWDDQVYEDAEPDEYGCTMFLNMVKPYIECKIINTPTSNLPVALNQYKRAFIFNLPINFDTSNVVENQLWNQLHLNLQNVDKRKVENGNSAIARNNVGNPLILNNLMMNKKSDVKQGVITKKSDYISKNIIVASLLITSVLASAIFILYLKMLVTGIVLGACCLVLAAIVKSPSKISDDLSIEHLNKMTMNVS